MFNDRLFSEVRSAIHSGKYKRLERLIQRTLPDEVQHYIISQLDRATTHNAWNLAGGRDCFDAPTILEAMIMSVEGARLATFEVWSKRFERTTSDAKMAWMAHRANAPQHLAPTGVSKVLVLRNADGAVFYRRIVDTASCLALEEHVMAFLSPTHGKARGFKRRCDWLERVAQFGHESDLSGTHMIRHIDLAGSVNDALLNATLHGLHDALYLHFVRHTNEQFHHSEQPWDSLKAVMLNAQLEGVL